MIDDMKVLLGLTALIATGLCVLGAIVDRDSEWTAELWLPLAYGLGLAVLALGVCLQLAVLKRVTPIGLPVVIVAAAGISCLRGSPWAGRTRWKGFSFLADDAATSARWAYRSIMILSVVYLALQYSETMHYPLIEFDGRAIFALKAKILFHERTLYTPSVTDPLQIHFHSDYPPLVPSAEFAFYELLGKVDDRKLNAIFYAVFAATALFLYGAVRPKAGPIAAAAVMAGYCTAGEFLGLVEGTPSSGGADLPLALLTLVAVVMMDEWHRPGRKYQVILAACFVGAALLTKKEGAVVLAVIAAASGLKWLACKREPKFYQLKQLALALAVALAIFIPWLIAKRSLPNHNENYAHAISEVEWSKAFGRIPLLWDSTLEVFTEYWRWNYAWPIYFGVLALSIRRWIAKKDYFLDAIILTWLFIYLFVYLITPFNIDFHLKSSFPRLLIHIFPIALYRIGLFFGTIWPGGAASETPSPLEAELDAGLGISAPVAGNG